MKVTFADWLFACNVQFNINYARYGQLGGHGFVTAIHFDECEVAQLVDDLDAGDNDALQAGWKLEKLQCQGKVYIGNDECPIKSMKKALDKILVEYNKL